MVRLKSNGISILHLIFETLLITTVLGIKSKKFTYDVSGGFGCFIDDGFLASPGQGFGCCKQGEVTTQQPNPDMKCTVIMETTKTIESQDHTRVCNFTFENLNTNGENNHQLSIIKAIDENKAVIINYLLLEHDYRSYILHFDDCRSVELDIPKLKKMKPTQFYAVKDGIFDAIITTRTDKNYYRMIFDTEGNIITEKQLYGPRDKYAEFLTVIQSPARGRLVVGNTYDDHYNRVSRIYAINENGLTEVLAQYPVDERFSSYEPIIFSSTYDLLTVCSNLNTTLTCAQFDLAGNLKFETDILLDQYSSILGFHVYNLPRGGFLLAILDCPLTDKNCYHTDAAIDLKKFDFTGHFITTLKMVDPGTGLYAQLPHIFVNAQNEICLSNVDQWSENISLYVTCLQEEEFFVKVELKSRNK